MCVCVCVCTTQLIDHCYFHFITKRVKTTIPVISKRFNELLIRDDSISINLNSAYIMNTYTYI